MPSSDVAVSPVSPIEQSLNLRYTDSMKKHGEASNGKVSSEYNAWIHMKGRCYRPTHNRYKWYGGRGIKVCERWLRSYSNFIEDMGRRPENMTLERIDNDGDYTPENCRWATWKEQRQNTRRTVRYTYDGQTLSLIEWSEKLNINYPKLWARLNTGKWPVEKAFSDAR